MFDDDLDYDLDYDDPVFNFSPFLLGNDNTGGLCDCTLVLPDGTQLEAHETILAHSSQFFRNAFTSGMSEQKTRTVMLTFDPRRLFPDVLKWMYHGKIEPLPDTIMPLLAIARFYGIEALADSLAPYYAAQIEPDAEQVNQCVRQCYAIGLPTALEFLIPTLSKNLGTPGYEIAWLSEALDVATFFAVSEGTDGVLSQKVIWLTEFLGDYELTGHEKELVHRIFAKKSSQEIEVALRHGPGAKWIDRDLIARMSG
jgi:hypothetical protein